jgi:phenylacetic acid degradation operon negative regulatory protein
LSPTPKSLVLDLLSTLRRGAMPVRALVEAAALFGIEGNSLRVALARMLAAGMVERDERGQYRMGTAAGEINAYVAGWRHLDDRMRRWDGGWVGVHGAEDVEANGTRRRGERALRFLGFRILSPGLAIRPDNLAGGLDATRAALHGLGLSDSALVFVLRNLDPVAEARARRLWDVATLRRTLRASRATLEKSAKRLPRLAAKDAMRESFLLGGAALRQLALDPLLPPEIQPGDEREALANEMARYDRLGRAAWAGFLDSFGVLPARSAHDVRMIDAATTLAAAGGNA